MTFEFSATLFVYPGKGGWTFARVPDEFAPPRPGPWGRTPVEATVNGIAWSTSVWTDKSGQTLLPIPKRIRSQLTGDDTVTVQLVYAAIA
jgi:hypothetical protein